MSTLYTTKIANLPSLYATGWVMEHRSVYELRERVGDVVRAYVVLPHGFGKAWELRTAADHTVTKQARKVGSRGRGWNSGTLISADPLSALVQWAEENRELLPTKSEAFTAQEAVKAAQASHEAERLARRQERIDEGNRLMDALGRIVTDHTNGLSLADRLDLAAVARALPGAFPVGVRKAVEVV